MDEEEVWKCPKHPSKRRRTGICPVCLKEKLASLCPDCAHARPCSCLTTSSSSSSSSSFARFSVSGAGEFPGGTVGRVSSLIDSEPAFRRSRSVALAVPLFLRSSRPQFDGGHGDSPSKGTSFWSLLTPKRKSKRGDSNSRDNKNHNYDDERIKMMSKSRSVAVTSSFAVGDVRPPSSSSSSKTKAWYFPSPMKVFRQSSSRVHKERSPLYRG